MRKLIPAVIVLAVLGVAAWFIVRHSKRTQPTSIGWRAHVTTIAGNGGPLFVDSNQAVQAGFAEPFGIAIAPGGTIYVSDAGESNRIRKISPDGSISTLAGNTEGFADGTGPGASFNSPSGLALDQTGNLYVADTGNNRIRKISPQGIVTTVAGSGIAGYQDGPAGEARFDSPIGLAVDSENNIYVADTYNDRVRKIAPDRTVSTVAGAGRPGYEDGRADTALFDTPSAIAVLPDKRLVVADTGNNRLRSIGTDGQVTTLGADLRKPVGIASTHDGFLYVTEFDGGRVTQLAPDGNARVIAVDSRFSQPAGVSVDERGDLYLADSGSYSIQKLTADAGPLRPESRSAPQLSRQSLGIENLLWPIDPQDKPHEVVATMGEVRGSFDSTDSRDHLHSGIDIFGGYGNSVRVVRTEKVSSPIPNWGFGDLNEGIRIGVISYIHIHLGRDSDGKLYDDQRFVAILGADGKPTRIRVRRGARFKVGDAIGTINRMYHLHLNVGSPGSETNPLFFSPVGFSDRLAPTIEKDGIQIFDLAGRHITEKQRDRLVVRGQVAVVVAAFDRADLNAERRRLGLYRLGYQILKPDGSAVPGFDRPRMNIEFNKLPPDDAATKLAYADKSGITVYGSKTTTFLYIVTNVVRDGHASAGAWDTTELAPGDYILRIVAADYSGNEAIENRDVLVTVTR
jgi:sugar lactone lactonase YvrE